jgi:hypothetical protein
MDVNNLKITPGAFGGYLNPYVHEYPSLKRDQGYYGYSLRVGGKLCILNGYKFAATISLSLLRTRSLSYPL